MVAYTPNSIVSLLRRPAPALSSTYESSPLFSAARMDVWVIFRRMEKKGFERFDASEMQREQSP